MVRVMDSVFDGESVIFSSKHAPKVDKFKRGYIYILQLSNGFTKIGCTADPYTRMSGLKRGLRSTNVKLCRLWVSCSHINYKDNEKLILSELSKHEKDGEFFKVQFNDALSFVSTLSVKTEFTAQEIATEEKRTESVMSAWNAVHELAKKVKP